MGTASAFVLSPNSVRPEGQSIVIHDTTAGKEKIGCADLMGNVNGPITTSGSFHRFPDTSTTLEGSASMVRDGDSTVVTVMVTGLLPMTAYGCHVHNLPGAIQKGGAHYQIDPTVTTAIDSNEIWLNFTTDSAGAASKSITKMVKARPEAQSIVVHAPGGTRIGWVDLMPPTSTSLPSSAIVSGTLMMTAAGTTAGYSTLVGKGLIVRANERTVASVVVTGLVANSAYGSHVHNMSCNQSGGAGHYKIDTTIAAAVDSNEIWTLLTTDATGMATGFGIAAGHIARPSAQSIVVHDTVSGARIACIDLMSETTPIRMTQKYMTKPYGLLTLGFNQFKIESQGGFELGLYNVRGKRIFTLKGYDSQWVNLKGISKGQYFSRIQFQNHLQTPIRQKIVID